MTLYIEDPIYVLCESSSHKQEILSLLRHLCVFFKEKRRSILVEEQKCFLSSMNVNSFLSLIDFDLYEVEYTPNGGIGVDLALTLRTKK